MDPSNETETLRDVQPSTERTMESTATSNPIFHKSNVSKPSTGPSSGRKRSIVWEYFTKIKTEDNSRPRAACNFCGTTYACDPNINGTKSMLQHLEKTCKKSPLKNVDRNQSVLGFKPGETSGGLVPIAFSVKACREALAEMLIVDKLPFRFVEGEGFKKFMLVVQPRWNGIPSRVTVAKDIFKLYLREKDKLKSALKGQRICLTTDTWTSVQNFNYLCLTAHFIDEDWKMHKRIISFCKVENHKDETLGKKIEMCLLEWGSPKIFTITLDNASSNNEAISYIKRKTMNRNDTILEHEFLHMRCCTHVLNLIVRDGLKEFDQSIARIRGAVKYVKSSLQRWNTFKQCCDSEDISCKNSVCLDEATRWNSTYMMLDKAEKFQKAFQRLENDDLEYVKSIGEDDSEDDDGVNELSKGGASKLGPPTKDDWDKSRLFVKFLKLFYDATLCFSGANNVTCNCFVFELATIQYAINLECVEEPHNLKTMAFNMKSKFEKYWENLENMNLLLYVGLVLDPRYKMHGLAFCLEIIYDHNSSKVLMLVDRVKDALTRLYDSYCENDGGDVGAQNKTMSQSSEGGANTTSSTAWASNFRFQLAQFKKHLELENSLESKSEVERYLSEKCIEDDANFNLLTWWKVNSIRYRVLSRVARNVLAVPISTVASESAFNTTGQVLDHFCSSLSPLMIEALICTQNWLRSSAPINIRSLVDDIEEFEKFDTELMEYLGGSSRPTSLVGDD
ncbi:hypothetical protein F2P56_035970 [Juglans regia]|uniref:BED-type domain-containing protein n=2 Tax=Juglans regia TaxID=51240 RepID=A0A833TXS5_JUGRE|nr:zinc finger BED domain-containing protein RICESLEEPER 2-like [Juglans regia]KAF5443414.1 hypothetical protein F2P56_035970 [Juglans regia]